MSGDRQQPATNFSTRNNSDLSDDDLPLIVYRDGYKSEFNRKTRDSAPTTFSEMDDSSPTVRWAVRCFYSWRLERNKQAIRDGNLLLNANPIERLDDDELVSQMVMFLSNVVSPDGRKYKPGSLKNLVFYIQRHLKRHGRKMCFAKDPQLEPVRAALDAIIRQSAAATTTNENEAPTSNESSNEDSDLVVNEPACPAGSHCLDKVSAVSDLDVMASDFSFDSTAELAKLSPSTSLASLVIEDADFHDCTDSSCTDEQDAEIMDQVQGREKVREGFPSSSSSCLSSIEAAEINAKRAMQLVVDPGVVFNGSNSNSVADVGEDFLSTNGQEVAETSPNNACDSRINCLTSGIMNRHKQASSINENLTSSCVTFVAESFEEEQDAEAMVMSQQVLPSIYFSCYCNAYPPTVTRTSRFDGADGHPNGENLTTGSFGFNSQASPIDNRSLAPYSDDDDKTYTNL